MAENEQEIISYEDFLTGDEMEVKQKSRRLQFVSRFPTVTPTVSAAPTVSFSPTGVPTTLYPTYAITRVPTKTPINHFPTVAPTHKSNKLTPPQICAIYFASVVIYCFLLYFFCLKCYRKGKSRAAFFDPAPTVVRAPKATVTDIQNPMIAIPGVVIETGPPTEEVVSGDVESRVNSVGDGETSTYTATSSTAVEGGADSAVGASVSGARKSGFEIGEDMDPDVVPAATAGESCDFVAVFLHAIFFLSLGDFSCS